MLFVAALAAAGATLGEFTAWQNAHGKVYSSKTEAAKRFRIFQDNAARIESYRLNNPLATFGLNKFSDLSRDEFRAQFNGFRANISEVRSRAPVAAALDTSATPTSFDWRTKSGVLAPIQDQGQCGSCWAFSATVNMESRIAIKTNKKVNKLAEQALVSCEHECGQFRFMNACDNGCNGGLMPNAFLYTMKNGLPTQASYPYTSSNGDSGTCKTTTSAGKVSGWEFVANDEKQMAAYLAANGPIAVAVDASNWSGYQGGIMTGSDICPTQDPNAPSLDHGVAIVGFGTDSASGTDYWIVRNSWAASWGEQGYLRILRGADYCGISLFACSAIA